MSDYLLSVDKSYREITGLHQNENPEPEPEPEPTTTEERPNDTWLKADIQDWLLEQGIDYDANATKADLLALVLTG